MIILEAEKKEGDKKKKKLEKKIWQKAGAAEARAHETFALTYFSFFSFILLLSRQAPGVTKKECAIEYAQRRRGTYYYRACIL